LSATVNAQGQLTALAATPIAVTNTQVSGLGTMSTQNANSVAITGGSVTGITDLAVLDGGTGASDASGARTNLGAAASATTITAGTGLSGGGDLSANRTLSITNTAVTAGSFGSASNTLTATVNAQGQLTALAATPIAIVNTQVSGLGTASVLNAGVALGVATLDAGGTVPLSQIPASIQGGVSYQGSWNAATNTPTLVSSVGSKGYYYVVSVAGSTNLNGITDWLPGDWAIFNGSVWEQIDNTDTVQSVNGYVGAVVLTAADVGAPPTTRSISTGTGLSGGGDLSVDRTLSISNTAVSAGSYGSASAVGTFTVNAQGQLTAASNTTIAIANTQVSGLGTMSTQNANSVAITGGSVNGTTIGATTASTVTGTTVTATTLVVNDNSTLGSSNSDTVSFNARVNSDIDPSTDNTYDLGRNAHAWRNLYLTGTANIAALSASGTTTLSGLTASTALALNASKQVVSVTNTGTGDNVLSNSPTLVTPALGTPASGVVTNLTGTASININGTVGATTASTGAFTALTTSSTVTLNGGTANGVAFLDASKVLTTGSALTFDGANALNMGASNAGAYNQFVVNNESSTGFARMLFQIGAAGATGVGVVKYAPGIFFALGTDVDTLSTPMTFILNNAEQMRLTSTGLGIGTSSPATKLDVSAANPIITLTGNANGTTAAGAINFNATSTTKWQIGTSQVIGNGFEFNLAGSNLMYLNQSGNLGLGVTPSAWATYQKSLDFGGAGNYGGLSSRTDYVSLASNAYFAASGDIWRYKNSSFAATDYYQSNGVHAWLTAPSGTAGDAISFSQVMTLDASGNLGVGTTSPSVRLDVNGSMRIGFSASGQSITAFNGDQTNQQQIFMKMVGTDGQLFVTRAAGIAANLLFGTEGSERARITSGGEVLVGLTSATGVALLQVSGPIRTTGYTVATLPAGTVGMRTYVTDALAPVFGVAVAGSGAVTIPVFYDGANWIVA
jgi:hypothetical protein